MMSSDSLGERIRDIFDRTSADDHAPMEELFALYHPEVRFEDPTQTLEGLDAFAEMNRKALLKATLYDLRVDEVVETPSTLFSTWVLDYRPKVGPALTIPGVTYARIVDGLIVEHRDYWDLLSAVMDAFPMAGPLYRAAVAKLV